MNLLEQSLKLFKEVIESSERASSFVQQGCYLHALLSAEYAIDQLKRARDFLKLLPPA